MEGEEENRVPDLPSRHGRRTMRELLSGERRGPRGHCVKRVRGAGMVPRSHHREIGDVGPPPRVREDESPETAHRRRGPNLSGPWFPAWTSRVSRRLWRAESLRESPPGESSNPELTSILSSVRAPSFRPAASSGLPPGGRARTSGWD
jgi:hypothetical protein